ncbi:MAG: phosphoribosylanthranilate isomerase [Pseudomonadota bacterium]
MTAVKICCIQSVDEAEMASAAGASAIGLVAAMPSGPGPIPDARIAEIAGALRGRIETVLLTAETGAEAIAEHVARTGPSAVQLVDPAAAAAIPALRALHPALRIFQVVHVADAGAVAEARGTAADALLLDSGVPGAGELGGTGRTHDWALSARIVAEAEVPVWLAGGLKPENAAEAIWTVRPHGLDICSGLRPTGVLDAGRLAAFMVATK